MVAADTCHMTDPMWLVPLESCEQEQSDSANHSVEMFGYVEEIQHQTGPFCFHLTTFCPKMPVFPDNSAV